MKAPHARNFHVASGVSVDPAAFSEAFPGSRLTVEPEGATRIRIKEPASAATVARRLGILPEALLPVLNTLSKAPLPPTPALEQEHGALASRLVTVEATLEQLQEENKELRLRNQAQVNHALTIAEWSAKQFAELAGAMNDARVVNMFRGDIRDRVTRAEAQVNELVDNLRTKISRF